MIFPARPDTLSSQPQVKGERKKEMKAKARMLLHGTGGTNAKYENDFGSKNGNGNGLAYPMCDASMICEELGVEGMVMDW